MQGEHGIAGRKYTLEVDSLGFPREMDNPLQDRFEEVVEALRPRDSLGERIEDEMERPSGAENTLGVWVAWLTRGKELVPLVREH